MRGVGSVRIMIDGTALAPKGKTLQAVCAAERYAPMDKNMDRRHSCRRPRPCADRRSCRVCDAPLSWQHIVLPCRDLRQTQRRHPDPLRIHDAALATKNATVYELSIYMLRMCDNDTFG